MNFLKNTENSNQNCRPLAAKKIWTRRQRHQSGFQLSFCSRVRENFAFPQNLLDGAKNFWLHNKRAGKRQRWLGLWKNDEKRKAYAAHRSKKFGGRFSLALRPSDGVDRKLHRAEVGGKKLTVAEIIELRDTGLRRPASSNVASGHGDWSLPSINRRPRRRTRLENEIDCRDDK